MKQRHLQRRSASLSISLLFLSTIIQYTPVVGFAAWLKCYVDLNDSEEIIMNLPIVPFELQNEQQKSVTIEMKLDEPGAEWYKPITEFVYPSNSVAKIQARLKVPDDLSRQNVQYVMEFSSNGCASKKNVCKTKFVRPAMCDGKRGHSNDYSTPVVFEIDTSTSVNNPITIFAVWAGGREAVKRTPVYTIRRSNDIQEL